MIIFSFVLQNRLSFNDPASAFESDMKSITAAVSELKQLEQFADGTSAIHGLDARAKVLVTFVFIVTVVSFNRYELTGLLPFFAFPAAMVLLAGLPPFYLLRKIALICPFVLMVGIFNPVFDRTVMHHIGQVGISGGWISLASLLIRSCLTVGAAIILVGTTGFTLVCYAFERLGVPHLFAVQLLFLHRYIFVLADETGRAARARELRSCGAKGLGITSFASLAGHLLLRTWQRAEHIHTAMLARGFDGRFHAHRQSRLGLSELAFVVVWSAFFIILRMHNFGVFNAGIAP